MVYLDYIFGFKLEIPNITPETEGQQESRRKKKTNHNFEKQKSTSQESKSNGFAWKTPSVFCGIWIVFFPPATGICHSKGSALDGDKMYSAIKHSWQGKHPGFAY